MRNRCGRRGGHRPDHRRLRRDRGGGHGPYHCSGYRAQALLRDGGGQRGQVLQVDAVDIGPVLLSTFLARRPSARQHLLLVARAVTLMARGVTCQPGEVFWNTMRVGPDDASREGGSSHIGAARCQGGGQVGGACGDWGYLNILCSSSSGCGSQRHLLSEFLRLLDGWRVVSTLRVLSPASCESLPLKRVGLRLNLLCYACGGRQGDIRRGCGGGLGTSDWVCVLRHAECSCFSWFLINNNYFAFKLP